MYKHCGIKLNENVEITKKYWHMKLGLSSMQCSKLVHWCVFCIGSVDTLCIKFIGHAGLFRIKILIKKVDDDIDKKTL